MAQSGLLDKRLWARTLPGSSTKVTTTYDFEMIGSVTSGRLATKTYNDGTLPVTYTYRRDGQLATVKDASGIRTLDYHSDTGLLDTETITANSAAGSVNLLAGGKTTRAWLRKDWPASVAHSLESGAGSQALYAATYQMASAVSQGGLGGLGAVNGGAVTFFQPYATHAYRTTAYTSGSLVYERIQESDALGRVKSGRFGLQGWAPMLGHSHTYDAMGRRSAASITGYGAYPSWGYSYNERGEVIGAARGTPSVVESQSWGYGYDNLGNRFAATRGPAGPELAARTTSYRPNALNQYESDPADDDPPAIAHSRRVELSGQLADGAAVQARWAGLEAALDGTGTGEPGSWRAEMDVGADWGWFALEAEGSTPALAGTMTRRGWHYVPPAAEDITHDTDGNLIADARWTYKWDAENRLIEMTEKAGIPVHDGGIPAAVLAPPARRQLTFDYDAEGRRIAKVVREWNDASSSFSTLVKDQRFLYDGWNMTVELNHTSAAGTGLTGSTVQREYVWGPDLSGTMQGAGGVGGLLMIRSHSSTTVNNAQPSSTASYAPCYDGNGNITGWARLDGGYGYLGLAARYDYDPFGNRVTAVEPRGEVCPLGFSTKYRDEETGDLYYGHRFYRPRDGRWPNRDPIGEQGGINLYGMVGNDPVNRVDGLGLTTFNFTQSEMDASGGRTHGRETIADITLDVTEDTSGCGKRFYVLWCCGDVKYSVKFTWTSTNDDLAGNNPAQATVPNTGFSNGSGGTTGLTHTPGPTGPTSAGTTFTTSVELGTIPCSGGKKTFTRDILRGGTAMYTVTVEGEVVSCGSAKTIKADIKANPRLRGWLEDPATRP